MTISKKVGLVFMVPGVALIMAAGFKPVMRDPGTTSTVAKTKSKVLSANDGRTSFCIKAEDSNTDVVRYYLKANGAGLTTANGMALAGGGSYCDPVAGEPTYTGEVWVIAVTTAGTVSVDVQEK